jgi:hypothetical protein
MLGQERQAGALERRLPDEVLIVKDKGTRDRDRNRLVGLVEFSLVDALAAMAEVDTSMSE